MCDKEYWEPWKLCSQGKGEHCQECEYDVLCNSQIEEENVE